MAAGEKTEKGQSQRREAKPECGTMAGLQTDCVMGTAGTRPWAVAQRHGTEKPEAEQMRLSVML